MIDLQTYRQRIGFSVCMYIQMSRRSWQKSNKHKSTKKRSFTSLLVDIFNGKNFLIHLASVFLMLLTFIVLIQKCVTCDIVNNYQNVGQTHVHTIVHNIYLSTTFMYVVVEYVPAVSQVIIIGIIGWKQIGAVHFISILLLIQGIESNPGPQIKHVNITGSFHQGSLLHFSSNTVGRQCVPNSIAAIAYSKLQTNYTWTMNNMDTILRKGDELYQQISAPSDLLEFDDLPTHFSMYSRQFAMYKGKVLYCAPTFNAISDVLSQLISQKTNKDILLFLGDASGAYASSIMYRDQILYMFDAHSRSHVSGLPVPDGTSTMLSFLDHASLAKYLELLSTTLHSVQLSFVQVHMYTTKKSSAKSSTKSTQKEHLSSCTSEDLNIIKCGQDEMKQVPSAKKLKHHDEHSSNTRMSVSYDNGQESEHNPKSHHKQTICTYICSLCERRFYNSFNKSQHEQKCLRKSGDDELSSTHRNKMGSKSQKHNPEPDNRQTFRVFNCSICNQKFYNSFNRLKHEEKCSQKSKNEFFHKGTTKEGIQRNQQLSQYQLSSRQVSPKAHCYDFPPDVQVNSNFSPQTGDGQERNTYKYLQTFEKSMDKKDMFFPCGNCDKQYDSIHNRNEHLTRCGKAIICEQCNKTFTRPSNLTRHKKQCQNKQNFNFTCDMCNQRFTRKDNLMKHMKQCRTCPWCGLKPNVSVYMQKHVNECEKRHSHLANLTRLITEKEEINERIQKSLKQIQDNIEQRSKQLSSLQLKFAELHAEQQQSKHFAYLPKQICEFEEQISKYMNTQKVILAEIQENTQELQHLHQQINKINEYVCNIRKYNSNNNMSTSEQHAKKCHVTQVFRRQQTDIKDQEKLSQKEYRRKRRISETFKLKEHEKRRKQYQDKKMSKTLIESFYIFFKKQVKDLYMFAAAVIKLNSRNMFIKYLLYALDHTKV